ncbi:UvrD-helicase domain-containing protein [Paenibacillus sp. LHD-117]|uniref:ATP-dependent helicase n=1 Tax=Paenibacillus sp. LHD-117 TaxID=3071412 RepID=UPI0027DF759D|nr:UvrD-helicase domain-containing protein [Paenibacillus sp. LHD-117]MDQ6419618.1 UvrD-helicase domain-containing protein [Paenibacillus sp. LHD-117]
MKGKNAFLERKKKELGVALNDVQRKAVLRTDGPLLLLASPGSGKTTTMIMRVGYMIEEKGVSPSRIKAVTFSRASARDMKDRFGRFFPELTPVDFSTIHSLAFEIARERFWRDGTAYQIIEGRSEDEEEEDGKRQGEDALPLHKRIILRNLFKQANGENITDEQLEELSTFISYVKNKMIPEAEWDSVKSDVPLAADIMREYESFKRGGHAKLLIDFDDMLTIANETLERDAQMLKKYQRRYDYVLTDESQDTSMVQHAIIEKMVREHRNLCVVADDDQSIYSWRGAEPSYLLNFKDAYPEAAILFMEQNYRSTKGIVEAANKFIKRNKNRYNKNMFTNNAAGAKPIFKRLPDYRKQAGYLVRQLQQEEKLSEAAVLFRNNSSSIVLMNEFDRAGIPFYMKDADNRFFSHWVVEDVLNFMRMTFTDKRADLLERIHLKLSGYISKHQMAVLKEIDNNESVFDNLLRFVKLHDYQVKPITEAKETFREMRGMPPKPAIRVIRGRLGYEKALEKMCERLGFRKEYLVGILNTLEDIADGLETMEDFAARLKYLETLLRSAKGRRGQNVVTFSTFHSAKGLEFDRVYLVDLIEGIIPSAEDAKYAGAHKKDGGTGEQPLMEEAVRLFYVGMTRARKHLELISYAKRDGEETAESSFMLAIRDIVEPGKREAAAKGAAERRMSAAGVNGLRAGGAGTALIGRGGESSDRGGTGANARGTGVSRPGSRSAYQVKASLSPGVPTVTTTEGRSAAPSSGGSPRAIRERSALKAGLSVRHRVFGSGIIRKVTGDGVEILFGENRVKSLSVSLCLEKGLLEPEG